MNWRIKDSNQINPPQEQQINIQQQIVIQRQPPPVRISQQQQPQEKILSLGQIGGGQLCQNDIVQRKMQHDKAVFRSQTVKKEIQEIDQNFNVSIQGPDLNCKICLAIPDVVYTSECCGTLICDKCKIELASKNHNSCPQCRNISPNFQKNTYLMKQIKSVSIECKHKCGFTSHITEMKEHIQTCPERLIECNICQFKSKKNKFLTHITKQHEIDVIQFFEGSRMN